MDAVLPFDSLLSAVRCLSSTTTSRSRSRLGADRSQPLVHRACSLLKYMPSHTTPVLQCVSLPVYVRNILHKSLCNALFPLAILVTTQCSVSDTSRVTETRCADWVRVCHVRWRCGGEGEKNGAGVLGSAALWDPLRRLNQVWTRLVCLPGGLQGGPNRQCKASCQSQVALRVHGATVPPRPL